MRDPDCAARLSKDAAAVQRPVNAPDEMPLATHGQKPDGSQEKRHKEAVS
jgi:hypothetical protein